MTAGAEGVGPVSQEERLARVALCRLSEPGDPRVARAVVSVGAVEVRDRLLRQHAEQGLLDDVAGRLSGLDPARDLEEAAVAGIRYVVPGDAEWPVALNELDLVEALHSRGGRPLGLWVRGPMRLDQLARAVAVVGSRSATSYGADVAGEIGATLAQSEHPVVSGAAFGIDQAAHRGALAVRGPTVAVLACGVDRAYPAAHRQLLDYLAETGAVISELAPGCAPTKLRFLTRNRLIAGLCVATVVVEAAIRSGALSTAGWAEQLHRPVLGVPGPVTSAPSAGVHELIRTRGALLVTRGAEVLEVVSPMGEALLPVPRGPERVADRLSLRDQQVLDALPARQPAPVDRIARVAGLAVASVEKSLERLYDVGLTERAGHLHRLRREESAGHD